MSGPLTCPECGRDVPNESAFCLGCGANLGERSDDDPSPWGEEDPAAAADGSTETPRRTICPTCGVIAPTAQRTCAVCENSLEDRQRIPVSSDGTYWVGLRCHFQCRSCGHLSPLNQLDMDGSVQCHHCGLDQAFDVDSWSEGLQHGHAVGDLAGPHPEGLHPHPRLSIVGDNPMARVGVDLTAGELTLSGTTVGEGMVLARSLKMDASPGHPLCRKCHVPLEHTVDGRITKTRCPACGLAASYELPKAARRYSEGVRGIVASDLRSDRPSVKAELASGVMALACPGCGAGLQDVAEGKTYRCPFCKTVSRIPDRLIQRYFDRAPEPETWWLLFEGASPRRRQLEDTSDLAEEGKGVPEVEKAKTLDLPFAIRFFTTVLIPAAVLLAVGVAVFADKIAALFGYGVVWPWDM